MAKWLRRGWGCRCRRAVSGISCAARGRWPANRGGRIPKRFYRRFSLRRWLTGRLRDWADDLLAEDRLRRQGWLNAPLIARCWSEHRSGAKNWQTEIWHALMLQAWLDKMGR